MNNKQQKRNETRDWTYMKFSRFKDMDGSRYIVRLESKHKADIHALYLFFRDNFFPSDFTNVDEEGSILDWEIEVF